MIIKQDLGGEHLDYMLKCVSLVNLFNLNAVSVSALCLGKTVVSAL